MTGKSYSIREMNTIVEYLTENKLYGEIRGRKMWMDLAASKVTTRTWQSLKETFLKRILPDIHNPYYKLSIEQINSFRAGYDISDKYKNKLEIHTISDDSSSNGATQNDKPQSNNDISIKEETLAGEILKCSTIPSLNRSSADTVIVETCYETAEDIQKDLESPRPDARENGENKSFRDCITYSEPLTPMLQEVLDDFQSEPENDLEASDRENQLEIVSSEAITNSKENVAPITNSEKNFAPITNSEENVAPITNSEENVAPIINSEKNVAQDIAQKEQENVKTNNVNSEKNVPPADEEVVKKTPVSQSKDNPNKEVVNTVSENDKKSNDVVEAKGKEDSTVNDTANGNVDASKNSDVSAAQDTDDVIEVLSSTENAVPIITSGNLNHSNSTPDASLPNNPEALKKRRPNENLTSSETNIKNKSSRKRSNSEHVTQIIENKKSRLKTKKSKSTSETDSKKGMTTVAPSKSKNLKQKETPLEVEHLSNNKDEAKSNNSTAENLANDFEKPSTSIAEDVDKVLLTSDSDQTVKLNESAKIKNPCLENVSLFEEQFNKLKYKSESSDVEQKKNENTTVKTLRKENLQKKEVVMLKSHTESESDETCSPTKKQRARESKKEREKALANIFGFSSGVANLKRKKQLSRRRRTISQTNITHNKGDSGSSEWTSESESEHFVSPPRGRRNRHTKKYLKPQSGRILSLEEEGGLFVMYGKKIYPLIKDGKLVKNYLTYLPDSESEEENYWKLKYVEEKKKAAQLKKLLQKAKEPDTRKSSTSEQNNPSRNSMCHHNPPPQEGSGTTGKEVCVMGEEKKVETKTHPPESIKIKFTTKNDQEIHLEGNWPQIHNVLEHVVHIFHKEPQPVSQKPKTIVEPPSSGLSTPVVITAVQEPTGDPVHEKVNKIESEIFKEIEERDKEEPDVPQANQNMQEANVTKRRPVRTRNSSLSSVPPSPAKRQKVSDQQDSKETENKNEDSKEITNENGVTKEPTKRQSRTLRKVLNDSLNTSETRTVQTRRSKSKLDTSNNSNDDEEIRYMLAPNYKRQLAKASASKNAKNISLKSTTEAPKIFSSPETECPNTMESTQGYQDTDPSPAKNSFRKKKYMNVSVLKSKAKSHLRRSSRLKPLPRLYIDGSNISSIDSSIHKIERDNSTLNTEVYRTESYQLLMPKVKNSSKQLEQINETGSIDCDEDFIKHLDSNSNNEVFSVQVNNCFSSNNGQISNDVGSSSNISLPLSPELSVVESLSISKDLINDLEDGPTLNEMQCDVQAPTDCSQYLMSQIDVSLPLMQQKCGFEINKIFTNDHEPKSHLTESLLSKIGTFSIKDQTDVTGNLDLKLRDLLLESAKKITVQDENGVTKMEVDTNVEVPKRIKNKKRCSTPRKRKDSLKSKKTPKVQPVIVEEHMETYSHGGRYSCPPIIQTVSPVESDINLEFNIADLTINENAKSKGRKKKDVIKVKILRPKHKKSLNTSKIVNEISKISICNDSGINDPEPGLFAPADESVDLIHNHSETCLHTNECVGDSVEFIDNSVKSILTLEDSMQSGDNTWQSQCGFTESRDISPDFFCNNAQDDRSFYRPISEEVGNVENTTETVYHSPVGTEASSLITEDLSDDVPQPESRPNKWYLLSDDETTNTNFTNAPAPVSSFGANLKQIFPIVCAVPDLSTISEISRENDSNSRKPTLESVTGDNLVSSNVLDSNFSM